MSDLENLKKVKDAIIFETAWRYETMPKSKRQKDDLLETIKVIWNRSIGRAGVGECFGELGITEEDVKKAAEFFNSKDKTVFVTKGIYLGKRLQEIYIHRPKRLNLLIVELSSYKLLKKCCWRRSLKKVIRLPLKLKKD